MRQPRDRLAIVGWLVAAILAGGLVVSIGMARTGSDGPFWLVESGPDRFVFERNPMTPTVTEIHPVGEILGECDELVAEWHPTIIDQQYVDAHGHGVVGCETHHEHGDAPPQWTTDWSMEHFGEGVIYGRDEATSNELALKPNAYKGQIVPSNAGGTAYVRYHGQSNPHGRAAQLHSYEVYYRDSVGNVSFFQGWIDCGVNPERRFPRSQGDPGTRPAMLVVDQAAWDGTDLPEAIRTEQWYCHALGEQLVEIGVNIGDTSTIWHSNEEPSHDPADWDVTGEYGTNRLVDFFLIETRFDDRVDWFCLTVMGAIIDCGAEGALPQYVAPTLYDDMRIENGVSRISGQSQIAFECVSCRLPN